MMNNKINFFRSKKGMIFKYLIAAVLGIFALIILSIIFSGGSSKSFAAVGSELAYVTEDCDNDGINNRFDDCPCLPTIGEGDPDPNKLGCPKGLTDEEVHSDRSTCFQYVTDTEGEFSKDCDEEEEGECQQRCEAVFKTTLLIKKVSKKGLAGNWDLSLASLTAEGNKKTTATPGSDSSYDEDLRNNKESTSLKVSFEIENKGTQKVGKPFQAQFFVCDERRENCKPTLSYDDAKGSKESGLTFTVLEAGKKLSAEKYLIVGANGDYCDGEGNRECYIKLMIDSDDDLIEGNEEDNEAGVFILLQNQKWEPFEFTTRKSIHIDGNEDEPGTTYPIKQYCKGYIADDSDEIPEGWLGDEPAYVCPSGDDCNEDFHQEDSPLWPASSGCWVEISESDWSDDCGEVLAVPGFYINIGNPSQIEWDKSVGYHSDDDDDEPKTLVEGNYRWAATSEGSILCSDNVKSRWTGGADNWEVCDDEGEGGIAKLKDGREFVCRGKRWFGK